MSGAPSSRELRLWRRMGRALPPLPHMLGVANHIIAPLFARHPRDLVQIDVLGRSMVLDPHQHVDAMLLFAPHLVDRRERAFLAATLHPGGAFLDAGAYLGFYTLQLAHRVGAQGRVIAVEAHTPTAERLIASLQRNALDRVQVVRHALTANGAAVRLTLDDAHNAGSRTARPGGTIPSETMPQLMKRLEIARFDAVKMDLEGLDATVVTEALGTLPPHRWPRRWVVEDPIEGPATTALRDAGYTVTRLSRLNLGASLD